MKKTVILLASFVLTASFSFSQEKGAFGFNFRVDPQPRIGVTYHLSEKFALRPYIGLSFGSVTSESEFEPLDGIGLVIDETEEESTNLIFGLGLFYYFYSKRDFSLYTGINFNYTRETVEVSFSSSRPLRPIPEIEIDEDSTGDIYQTSALLGVQCKLMKNLAIFGEIGFGYTYGKFERENRMELNTESKRWGLANSGIGLIFYF